MHNTIRNPEYQYLYAIYNLLNLLLGLTNCRNWLPFYDRKQAEIGGKFKLSPYMGIYSRDSPFVSVVHLPAVYCTKFVSKVVVTHVSDILWPNVYFLYLTQVFYYLRYLVKPSSDFSSILIENLPQVLTKI